MNTLSSLIGIAAMALCSIAIAQENAVERNWVAQQASTPLHAFSVMVASEEEGRHTVYAIKVTNRTTGAVAQDIDVEGALGSGRKPSELLTVVDANFDGHPDLAIPFSDGGAGPNYTLNFYLFNPKTKRFEYDEGLSNLPQIAINPNRTVTTASRGGCCQHGTETYRYVAGKLTLVGSWEENYTFDGKWIVTSTGKRIAGKMRYTEKRRRQLPNE